MARLRIAPSPTGFLHLGTLRTALFSYLLAKKLKGQLILRIEDTDQKREVEGAVEALIRVFEKMGIAFDEGPIIQSERKSIYQEQAHQLVTKGEAYYCFATAEELEAARQEQIANHLPPRYNRAYREYPLEEAKRRIEAGESYVVRHKLPLEGTVVVHDELRGDISFSAADLDDYVLLKSDGLPTYQLASVVDDHLMEISHVTRGDEWLPSLPKNILLYKSFGWEPPKFIHLPLILNKVGGGKLSKRKGDVFVEDFLAKGYLKEAIINFVALLGWHPKDDKEIFSLEELEQNFDIAGLGTSPAVFDDEKLDFFNAYYIRQQSLDQLLELARPFLQTLLEHAPAEKRSDDFIKAVLAVEQPRLKILSELSESVDFFFKDELEYEAALLVWKKTTPQAAKACLIELMGRLDEIEEGEWETAALEEKIVAWLKTEERPLGDYLWPMRVALSGRKASPGPFEIAGIIGKDETLAKMRRASSML